MTKNKKNPLVSIVILNWNGLEDTKLCLEHVKLLDYDNFEIIVVDNGSSQKEKDYLSSLKNIIFVNNPKNRGFAGGQADGLKYASGEFILLLNNDAVIDKDYLRTAIPTFDDVKVAVVGGKSFFWNDEEELFDIKNRYYAYMTVDTTSAETHLQMKDNGIKQEVNTVSGSAVLVRKSVIDTVGYLWEPFFAYYEETDLFARIKRAGYKIIYHPNLFIWHKNGASSGAQDGSYFFYYHIFRNRFIFALRNFEKPYIYKFIYNYLRLWIKSFRGFLSSANHRRLTVSYTKAIISNLFHLPLILYDRKKLSQKLSNDYCHQVMSEQIKISIVIDATDADSNEIKNYIKRISNEKKINIENIIITNNNTIANSFNDTEYLRIINNKGFFKVHPASLGVIASRMEWVIIKDFKNRTTTDDVFKLAMQLSGSAFKAIYKKDLLLIKKDYLLNIGSLKWNKSNLKENLNIIANYAELENMLYKKISDKLNIVKKVDLRKEIKNNKIISLSVKNRIFNKLSSKSYRFYQAHSLFRWLLSTKIPIRLKLGRTKNIILNTLSLKRKELAIELRHTRNELGIYGVNNKISGESDVDNIKTITNFAKKYINEIPVFIICFERVESLKKLVSWLESKGLSNIIFIDNDSSYPPLLDFYSRTPYQVIKLSQNVGHKAPWDNGIIKFLAPEEYYVVTDPDVIPIEECPNDVIDYFLNLHLKYPGYQKIGLGLKIDDLPDHYPLKDSVIEWENQFWQTELEKEVYDAPVDTTFALYKPYTYRYFLAPSIRTGGNFTARHLPWYTDPSKISSEEKYYRIRASADVTSWNTDELPDRYVKEMAQ